MKKILTAVIILLALACGAFGGSLADVAFMKDGSPYTVKRWFEDSLTPEAVVKSLLEGVNTDEAEAGIYSSVPKDWKLESVKSDDGYLNINFVAVKSGTQYESGDVDDVLSQFLVSIRYRFNLIPRIYIDSKPLREYIAEPQDFATKDPYIPPSINMAAKASGNLAGKKITVRGGHGWVYNPSKTAWVTERGNNCSQYITCEDFHTQELMVILGKYLEAEGATVIYARDPSKDSGNSPYDNHPWWQMGSPAYLAKLGYPTSLYGGSLYAGNKYNRYASANLSNYLGADMYISIHTNALSGDCYSGCGTGIESYYSSHKAAATSESIADLCLWNCRDYVRKYYDSSFACRRSCESVDYDFSECYVPDAPSTLFEFAFHDNCVKDAKYLADNFFRTVGMYGIYEGICEFFGTSPSYAAYSAEYVSDDIPATVNLGETRTVHVTFRNRGLCWNSEREFKLGAVDDSDPFTTTTRQTLSSEVMPEDTVTFTFDLTFSQPGTFTTDWRMLRENDTWFGDTVSKQVTVIGADDKEAPTVPQNLREFASTSNTATIKWDASTDNYAVAGYKIYRGNTQVGTTADTSYTFTSLGTGNYSCSVAAYDYSGNTSARTSNLMMTCSNTFFEDGFASLDNWTVIRTPFTLNSDKNHGTLTGANSMYVASSGVTQMYRTLASNDSLAEGGYRDGKFSSWMYDSGVSGMRGGPMVYLYNSAGSMKAIYFIGVNGAATPGLMKYCGGVYSSGKGWTYYDLGDRSVGWHYLEAEVSAYTGLDDDIKFYVDGTLKATAAAAADADTLVMRRVYMGYNMAANSEYYLDDISFAARYPIAPSSLKQSGATDSSITWAFVNNSNNATGFKIVNTSSMETARSYDWAAQSVTETGLAPNTSVTRRVCALNGDISSGLSVSAEGCSLSASPTKSNVTAALDGSNVVFTAVGGFGTGTLAYYRYVWNNSASYTFTDSEDKWAAPTMSLAMTNALPYYLHVKSYNRLDAGNGTLDLGPYMAIAPMTIDSAKSLADGSNVCFKDVVVTGVFADGTYVCILNGVSGIKLVTNTVYSVGDTISLLYGKIQTANGERYIEVY